MILDFSITNYDRMSNKKDTFNKSVFLFVNTIGAIGKYRSQKHILVGVYALIAPKTSKISGRQNYFATGTDTMFETELFSVII